MTELGLEYSLAEYSGDINGKMVYPYFVGDYTEIESFSEDGLQESTFRLNGFSRDTWLTLETAREKIENRFNRISGDVVMVEDGSAVAIFYANALIIPTGDAELKRMQINLKVQEWKVN